MIETDMKKIGAGAMTIASQNFGGPPGAAALILGKGFPMRPVIQGGVQERNLRAGQENIPAIAGMGAAAALAKAEMADRATRLIPVRDAFIEKLPAAIPDVIATGHPEKRMPNHASFVFRGVDGNALLVMLDVEGFACSSGSACKTGDPEPSDVLTALGLSREWALGSLRVTLGNGTSPEQIDAFLQVLPEVVERVRALA